MRKSLQFERCSAAHRERASQQRLKGYYDGLPSEALMSGLGRRFRNRPAVHTPRHLIEPAMGDVFLAQASGIAVLFEPGRVGDQTIRKGPLQPV